MKTLSLVDWDRFVADRLSGRVAPAKVKERRAVGKRIVGYDMICASCYALGWAARLRDEKGKRRLKRNPWEGGKSAGFVLPTEESPRRVIATREEYEALRKVTPAVHPDFDAALVLVLETGHRLASIRGLRWSDVDFTNRRVYWRATSDKQKWAHATRLTDAAVAALAGVRLRRPGDGFVFPSDENPELQRSRSTFSKWWAWAEAKAGLAPVQGRG